VRFVARIAGCSYVIVTENGCPF